MKNIIIITGGAGFVGSNLILFLLKKTDKKLISLDNYTSGSKKNHIQNSRVKYLRGNTKNIKEILGKYSKNIHTIFHRLLALFVSHCGFIERVSSAS